MTTVILCLILAANGFLIARYCQGKLTFLTDLLSRMAGVSFFIIYIWFQYLNRRALHLGFDTPVHVLSWVNWILIMGIFAFFIVVYLIRANPVVRATSVRETLLPLWCSVLPVLMLESSRLTFLPAEWIAIYAETFSWKLAAFLFLASGHAMTLISFLYLGRAFSIMVQARHVVQRGPYKYIRHPVYIGEAIAMIGILLNVPNYLNLVAMILWAIGQIMRARMEEAKLAATFPEYKLYKARTRACFPKI